MRKPRKIKPFGRTYRRLAIQEALAFVTIYPCQHCGGPVIKPYCCPRCGSATP